MTDSTVTFDAPPSSLDHVAIDTILVSEPAARAPAGMLRRVTAVRRDGQTLVVDTVHAAITDAVINGSFGFGTPVPLEPVEPTRGPDG